MKITDVKTFVVANPPPYHGGPYWVFVKLITDNNIEGIGEAYGVPFHPQTVARMIEDVVERYVIGRNPFQTEKLWRIIYRSGRGDSLQQLPRSCKPMESLRNRHPK